MFSFFVALLRSSVEPMLRQSHDRPSVTKYHMGPLLYSSNNQPLASVNSAQILSASKWPIVLWCCRQEYSLILEYLVTFITHVSTQTCLYDVIAIATSSISPREG